MEWGLVHTVPSSTGLSTASGQQEVLPSLGILLFLYLFTDQSFMKPKLSRATG